MYKRVASLLISSSALLGCMAMQGRSPGGGGGGGGGGESAAPDAPFYCAGDACMSSRSACTSSGIQLGAGWETTCTPSNEAWCANDRADCAVSEAVCNARFGTRCQRVEGPPPPPPPPPHRPDGPPDVLAVLGVVEADGAVTPLFCRYVDGALDPAGPPAHCPAAPDALPAVKIDRARLAQRSGWHFRVLFDELLGRSIGDGNVLFEGVVLLTCGDTSVGVTGTYEAGGNNTSDPVGPALKLAPRGHTEIAPGPCTLTLTDRVVDATGEPVPPDQRTFTFEVVAP